MLARIAHELYWIGRQLARAEHTVRDVFSAEMWEAINTFHLGLLRRDVSGALRTGPYSVYAYVKDRCGLFWGVTSRTMLRDEAHAFLQAGAAIESGDMVLRMLRVALPPSDDGEETHVRDGQALALLQAVGGFQAYRRTRWRSRSRRCTRRSPPPTRATAPRRPCCGSAA